MRPEDSLAYKKWNTFHISLIQSAAPDPDENEVAQAERIKRLEADPEAWFKYYFPKYSKYEPAKFHKAASKRIIKNDRWYEVRAWSRGFAKSTRTMFEFLYLSMTGRIHNLILFSYSYDNAVKLLLPWKLNLEKNQRLIHDYGTQMNIGQWTDGAFTTQGGCTFVACGSGQSPRGSRNEEIRPDALIFDDMDTDEECRNPKRIKDKWEWIEQAAIPTIDISENIRILFNGNIIAKDCTVIRAKEYADHADVINLVDKKGNSNWPEKVKPKDITYIRKKISMISFEKEYMNNPLSVGTVFKQITWDKIPPLNSFRFLILYGDPATSNKENKPNSHKAVFLVGRLNGNVYVITGRLEQTKNSKFVDWYWEMDDYVKDKTQIYNYIENNSLQDPFYEQVFIPLFAQKGRDTKHQIGIIPDTRKKPDKFSRIEGNLEPLNSQGKLIFNIAEKNNPHMKLLADQFLAVEAGLPANADGPDCIEGGYWIINKKEESLTPPTFIKRSQVSNKFKY